MVDQQHIDDYRRDGFVAIDPFVDAADVDLVRGACDEILSGRFEAPGDRKLGGTIRQVVLPHRDHPVFDQNPVLDAALDVARRLLGVQNVFRVYDQIIAKPPLDPNVTPWHQDQSYVGEPFAPAGTSVGHNAAMFWIALDDVDAENSCMHFVPGVHREPLLPHHVAAGEPTDNARLLAIEEPEAHLDLATSVGVPLRAGGCTVHDAGTPHMTPANTSATRGRRAYIIAIAGF